ncbi:MAG TPA: hypothetical protein VGX25_29425, partial [Actinophytocola sp.]|uniref:hypothetical protein n=1 Tax=Actinophytocola sp. TaxID=1872138 RepID=UPI002DDCF8B3
MVPEGVRQRWEVAYREYGRAWARADQSTGDCDGATAGTMAAASRELAVAWRELGAVDGLPWWVVAA